MPKIKAVQTKYGNQSRSQSTPTATIKSPRQREYAEYPSTPSGSTELAYAYCMNSTPHKRQFFKFKSLWETLLLETLHVQAYHGRNDGSCAIFHRPQPLSDTKTQGPTHHMQTNSCKFWFILRKIHIIYTWRTLGRDIGMESVKLNVPAVFFRNSSFVRHLSFLVAPISVFGFQFQVPIPIFNGQTFYCQ